ncbi:MAG TPA: UvrB/UvrC motif-containing protein [Candidatus Pacearchaeota archaeon]|nr:UvrB/UvrC motif-containing protein [Candidatus Pacearchaeota archaeon]HPR79946.1 UvrB/UvrC motif-containing protein [Candidatus Pacearchaeota archaeon]
MSNWQNKIKKIPETPGIYLFYKGKELVYIGKATSLRNRVKSYLNPKTLRPIEVLMKNVSDVKWKTTDSVLEAVILEANYIKEFKPKYNVKEKDDKSWNFFAITKEEFPKLIAVREHNLKKENYLYTFGPYAEMKTAQILKLLHFLFKVSRCNSSQKKPCFDYHLNNCLGVCTGEISAREYKEKVIKPLVVFLRGKKKRLISSLEKKMREASKKEDFEEAKRLRDQIFSLNKIRDFALLDKSFLISEKKEEKSLRIEGYDISNLGSEAMVGSMVVFNESGPLKSEYKKFKIKSVFGQSDVDCLKEILERRLKHSEWPMPDLILVDGGKPQVNAINNILKNNNLDIDVVGIAKGPERKKNEFFFNKNNKFILNNENLLIRVRDEAHRFAINYQRELKRRSLTS